MQQPPSLLPVPVPAPVPAHPPMWPPTYSVILHMDLLTTHLFSGPVKFARYTAFHSPAFQLWGENAVPWHDHCLSRQLDPGQSEVVFRKPALEIIWS